MNQSKITMTQSQMVRDLINCWQLRYGESFPLTSVGSNWSNGFGGASWKERW